MKFYGGFAGTEASPAERDIAAHPTILSGDIGLAGDSTDNSRTILYLDHPDSATLVSGFVFEKGEATHNNPNLASTDPAICGAGIYMNVANGSGSPVIEDCVFRKNHAQQDGGGFYTTDKEVKNTLLTFRRCQFLPNHSEVTGAAVLLRGGKDEDGCIEFDSCRFEGNRAEVYGAAVEYVKELGGENLQWRGCSFLKNSGAQAGL